MCTSALLTLTLQASLGIDPHLDLDDNFGGDLKGRVHVHASATMAPAAEEEVEVKKGEQLPPQSQPAVPCLALEQQLPLVIDGLQCWVQKHCGRRMSKPPEDPRVEPMVSQVWN